MEQERERLTDTQTKAKSESLVRKTYWLIAKNPINTYLLARGGEKLAGLELPDAPETCFFAVAFLPAHSCLFRAIRPGAVSGVFRKL